ncbi:hypothetical protein MMC18_000192 [Xylographa bjoerkii]|nr:hypothetical protein [Xylographa bjoerkii]
MYATNGLSDLLGISADELNGKSFYYCIQENCLQEAVKCLESAKANDSIAYLRFWFRDPRIDYAIDHDDTMSEAHSSDDDDGGVDLDTRMDTDSSDYHAVSDHSCSKSRSSAEGGARISQNGRAAEHRGSMEPNSRSSSGNSTDLGDNAADFMFDEPPTAHSSSSEMSLGSAGHLQNVSGQPVQSRGRQIELEAVVSCTSDGLVVVLRGARPLLSHTILPSHQAAEPVYTNGLFASPWATQPIIPQTRQHNNGYNNRPHQPSPDPSTAILSGPQTSDFMQSIREVAVFAWALTGINGSLDQYSRGTASGESQPPGGLPVWDPHGNAGLRRESSKSRNVSPGQADPNPYWPHMERHGVDLWDAQSRVRHWSGTQNLLSMAPTTLSPSQRQEELAAAAARRRLWR